MKKEEQFAICLDIGGTSVKSGIIGTDGKLLEDSLSTDPVDSAGSSGTILHSFAHPIHKAILFLENRGLPLAGIGISICGPFDYENGISKIRGLDKYESIYNVNVKKELQNILGLDDSIPLIFDVDAWAFGRGEVCFGAGRDFDRVIVITLGTGMGSAFAENGEIVSEGDGIPWFGWIAGQKYRDGILNDYVSRTFMMNRYRELTGNEIDIREMAIRADCGDKNAETVFTQIGTELAGFFLEHNVPQFKPECMIFGGQISRSFHLFSGPIIDTLSDLSYLKHIGPADDIECSALKGVAQYVFSRID